MPPEADPRKQAGPQVIDFGRNEGTGEKDQPVRQAGILYHTYCAKSLQSCPVLCNPMDRSPPGSSVHGFSRQEHWSGLLFLLPGDLPDSGIERGFPAQQADSLLSCPPGKFISESVLSPECPKSGVRECWSRERALELLGSEFFFASF